jgi:hypothetical protein
MDVVGALTRANRCTEVLQAPKKASARTGFGTLWNAQAKIEAGESHYEFFNIIFVFFY